MPWYEVELQAVLKVGVLIDRARPTAFTPEEWEAYIAEKAEETAKNECTTHNCDIEILSYSKVEEDTKGP